MAPRTPKTAVAEASFKIETDAISLGSIVDILSRGTPSINIKGFDPFTVPAPRKYKVTSSPPGRPEVCIAVKPGIRPANAVDKFAAELCFNSFV